MPDEKSIFMKTSGRALNILNQLHAGTAQAMYAYTIGQQREANDMALSNAILVEKLIGCYRVIPTLLGSPNAKRPLNRSCRTKFRLRLALPKTAGSPCGFPGCFPERSGTKALSNTFEAF